ncbi:hypothetical protein IMSAGC002_03447 [Lachnospiraceae bacterium]|nr:hypothetical protein IMSAGC002_03447 [Lachnospiraceae bacterium]
MGSKQKIRSKNRNESRKTPTRIVVERIYLGGQSMEDAFRKINEETVGKNIEEIVGKTV